MSCGFPTANLSLVSNNREVSVLELFDEFVINHNCEMLGCMFRCRCLIVLSYRQLYTVKLNLLVLKSIEWLDMFKLIVYGCLYTQTH